MNSFPKKMPYFLKKDAILFEKTMASFLRKQVYLIFKVRLIVKNFSFLLNNYNRVIIFIYCPHNSPSSEPMYQLLIYQLAKADLSLAVS